MTISQLRTYGPSTDHESGRYYTLWFTARRVPTAGPIKAVMTSSPAGSAWRHVPRVLIKPKGNPNFWYLFFYARQGVYNCDVAGAFAPGRDFQFSDD